MSVLSFSDGVRIDTSGPFKIIKLKDGYYVKGKGHLIPTRDQDESISTVLNLCQSSYFTFQWDKLGFKSDEKFKKVFNQKRTYIKAERYEFLILSNLNHLDLPKVELTQDELIEIQRISYALSCIYFDLFSGRYSENYRDYNKDQTSIEFNLRDELTERIQGTLKVIEYETLSDLFDFEYEDGDHHAKY
jgi:hypothetical protein